jgi:hypothetical protein
MSEVSSSNPMVCRECGDRLASFSTGIWCSDCGAIVEGKRQRNPLNPNTTASNLVARLRALVQPVGITSIADANLFNDAAAEIERLRLKDRDNAELCQILTERDQEIERLRAALERAEGKLLRAGYLPCTECGAWVTAEMISWHSCKKSAPADETAGEP